MSKVSLPWPRSPPPLFLRHCPQPSRRRNAKQNQAFYEFCAIKGYSTEMSLEVTSMGVQVHGGTGFIEETGALSTTATRF
jgi:alkylation response protein AidB-like acyl-CoA dehydrogenase